MVPDKSELSFTIKNRAQRRAKPKDSSFTKKGSAFGKRVVVKKRKNK
jgi:hypothetical protein